MNHAFSFRRTHSWCRCGVKKRNVGTRASIKKSGVTIILTTHYIEEAEEMADRIGIINKGEIKLVEKRLN